MIRKTNQLHLKSGKMDDLNTSSPIKIRQLQPIIKIIAAKYPQLKKHEISLIIKTFLEEVRQQLILGNTVNVLELFVNMRLYTFCRMRENKMTFNVQVQVSTPKHIKFKHANK